MDATTILIEQTRLFGVSLRDRKDNRSEEQFRRDLVDTHGVEQSSSFHTQDSAGRRSHCTRADRTSAHPHPALPLSTPRLPFDDPRHAGNETMRFSVGWPFAARAWSIDCRVPEPIRESGRVPPLGDSCQRPRWVFERADCQDFVDPLEWSFLYPHTLLVTRLAPLHLSPQPKKKQVSRHTTPRLAAPSQGCRIGLVFDLAYQWAGASHHAISKKGAAPGQKSFSWARDKGGIDPGSCIR